MTALGVSLTVAGLAATYFVGMTVLRAVCRHRWTRVHRSRGRDGFLVSREDCELCGEQRDRFSP